MSHITRFALLLSLGVGLAVVVPERAQANEKSRAEQAQERRKLKKDKEARDKEEARTRAEAAKRRRATTPTPAPEAKERPKKKDGWGLKDLVKAKPNKALQGNQNAGNGRAPNTSHAKQNCTTKVVFGISMRTCSSSSSSDNNAAPSPAAAAAPQPPPAAAAAKPTAAHHASGPEGHPADSRRRPIERQPGSTTDADFWNQGAKPNATGRPHPQGNGMPAGAAHNQPILTPDVAAPKKPSIDRTTFGLRLGEPSGLSRCSAPTATTTCIEADSPKPRAKDATPTYPSGYTAVPIILGADRCPPWLKSEGCRVTLAVYDGKVQGTSLIAASDPDNQRSIVEQLSDKYKRAPITTATASCKRAKSTELVTDAAVHVWDLEGMRVVFSPSPKDCARGNISVELESLQRARTAPTTAAAEPRM